LQFTWYGFVVTFFIAILKGCGLFHPSKGFYVFNFEDAKQGFFIVPIIGAVVGLLTYIYESNQKTKK
jgi:hypothetical protein